MTRPQVGASAAPHVTRRYLIAAGAAAGTLMAAGLSMRAQPARAAGVLRIASVKFGSLAWLLETIRAEGLDKKHGVALQVVETATNQSSPVALFGGTADVVVTDWPWALRQRSQGEMVRFAPFSAALGAVIVPANSPIQSLKDLAGKKLGVAGSSSDKSWLILQAYARQKLGFDLGTNVQPQYSAAPLLNEQLKDGRLDAILNFWTFAARLEAQGYRRLIAMSDVLSELAIDPQPALVGFIWKAADTPKLQTEIDAFLAAAAEANAKLVADDAVWGRLKPLMKAADDKELALLRTAYRSGVRGPWSARDMESAEKIMKLLVEGGDTELAKHGTRFDPGLFYAPGA